MVWGKQYPPLSEHEAEYLTRQWELTAKKFPNLKALTEFRNLVGPEAAKRHSQHLQRLIRQRTERQNIERGTPQLPPDFVKRVKEANYLDGTSMISLLEYLDFYNFAPLHLGHDRLYRFLLTPCTAALIPREFEQKTQRSLSHEVDYKMEELAGLDPKIPSMILGINMATTDRNQQRSSEETGARENMYGRQKPQLSIFVQLGVIGCCRLDQGNNQRIEETGWVLVMDVSTGRAGSVFIVFKTRPSVEDGEREYWGNANDVPDLGPNGYRQDKRPGSGFFVGFIARELTEGLFHINNGFYPDPFHLSQPELVSVRQKNNRLGLYKDPDTPLTRSQPLARLNTSIPPSRRVQQRSSDENSNPTSWLNPGVSTSNPSSRRKQQRSSDESSGKDSVWSSGHVSGYVSSPLSSLVSGSKTFPFSPGNNQPTPFPQSKRRDQRSSEESSGLESTSASGKKPIQYGSPAGGSLLPTATSGSSSSRRSPMIQPYTDRSAGLPPPTSNPSQYGQAGSQYSSSQSYNLVSSEFPPLGTSLPRPAQSGQPRAPLSGPQPFSSSSQGSNPPRGHGSQPSPSHDSQRPSGHGSQQSYGQQQYHGQQQPDPRYPS